MPKQLLRPGWVLTHLVVIAIAVSFVSLGMWQVRRHYEQAEENTRVEAQLASEPAPVGDGVGEKVSPLPGNKNNTSFIFSKSPNRLPTILPGMSLTPREVLL